jgi:hypothetical protein
MARRLVAPRKRRTADDDNILISVWIGFAFPTGRKGDPGSDWDSTFLKAADTGEPLSTFGGDPRLVCLLAWLCNAPKVTRDGSDYFSFPRRELAERVAAAMADFARHRPDLIDERLRAAAASVLDN